MMRHTFILDLSLMPSILIEVKSDDSLFFKFKLCYSSSELLKEFSSCYEKHKNKELLQFYICKGPGSYTGLKLAQIISEVLALMQTQVIDYTHFDLLNAIFEDGFIFCTYAYKNEFYYGDEKNKKLLVKKEDLLTTLNNCKSINRIAGKKSDLEHIKEVKVDHFLEDIYMDFNKIKIFISNFKSNSKLDLVYFRHEEQDFIPSILK